MVDQGRGRYGFIIAAIWQDRRLPVDLALECDRRLALGSGVTRNILDDPADRQRYQHAIPVITVNGREIARYRLSLQDLLAALDAASAATD